MDRLFDFIERHGMAIVVTWLTIVVLFWAAVMVVLCHFLAKVW